MKKSSATRNQGIGSGSRIHYSQCWEDPDVLVKALGVTPGDEVLSISSGGDNTLALALESPRRITAIDINPAQNYLLELKSAAIRVLSYRSFLEFLGIHPSAERGRVFLTLKPHLSGAARVWWEKRGSLISKGIIHAGKFERYLALFRRVLPLVHSRKMTDEFLSMKTLADQERFYIEKWDTFRWRLVFALLFNRPFLNLFGRGPNSFVYVGRKDIASHYRGRVERALREIPVAGNYFIAFILTGGYPSADHLPPYLKEGNFGRLKEAIGKIQFVHGEVRKFLSAQRENSFSKFNLSDIFETMSEEETQGMFRELARVGRDGGAIAYWNNLVRRNSRGALNGTIAGEPETAAALRQDDRVFFYDRFVVERIRKGNG